LTNCTTLPAISASTAPDPSSQRRVAQVADTRACSRRQVQAQVGRLEPVGAQIHRSRGFDLLE
jgi:hypothetical protein